MIVGDLLRESLRKTDWAEVRVRLGILGIYLGSVLVAVAFYGWIAWMVWQWVSP